MMNYLDVGKVANTFGVKGMIKVIPYTDDIKRFSKLKIIYIEKDSKLIKFKIQEIKYQNTMVLLKLEDIDTIEKAELYKNCMLKIDRKDAVKLPDNSYFIVDLIGLEVYATNNEILGKIEDVFSTGSNDVYVVKNDLGKQILLPAIKSVVKQIDINNKKIIVNLIEGLV